MRYHLDTDFLVKALFAAGPERELLRAISDSPAEIEMSALAWYEFCRGPRLPQQEAVARSYLEIDGVVALDESAATQAAEIFRRLGSSRRRAPVCSRTAALTSPAFRIAALPAKLAAPAITPVTALVTSPLGAPVAAPANWPAAAACDCAA